MVAALYRRYRPDSFAEMIGQAQVTEPLMTALRSGRVNHAYLFSGPRGCGKTSSARILARCMNCAQGPTDTPCGTCPSCVELARDGSGSLDVIEIDAASHGGVEDARDLRERAVLAPSRDRYKIFIIDEAHMVTAAGFNALLKVVEEPPEHVRFVFATTEPEKVIGTIRSRTHHFPFRLIPPALMLEYVEGLCAAEGVTAEPGVLPLVVRAGGGSARDTLSLLDQIMAGSEERILAYGRAAALLGFTGRELLDETIDAITGGSAAACFATVDRVIQSGQDPRRFVEDLLEHVRDLIIAKATGEGAASVLRGTSPEELDRLLRQAARLSPASLSRLADLVNASLSEMTGATSPRVHLELMMARLLVELDAGSGSEPDAGGDGAPRSSAQTAPRAPRQDQRQRAAPELASGQPPRQQFPPGPSPAQGAPAEARQAPAGGAAGSAGAAEADRFEGMHALLTGAPGTAAAGSAQEPRSGEPGPRMPQGERHAGPGRGKPGRGEPGGSVPERGGREGDGLPRPDSAEPAPAGSVPPAPAGSAPGSAPSVPAPAGPVSADAAPPDSVSAEPAWAEPGPAGSAEAGSVPSGAVPAWAQADPAGSAAGGPAPGDPASAGFAGADPASADPARGAGSAGGGSAAAGSARVGSGPAVPAAAGADHPGMGQAAARGGPGTDGQGFGESTAEAPRELALAQLRDAWPSILAQIKREGGIDAWTAVQAIQPRELAGDLLRFEVMNRGELERFKRGGSGGSSPAELLRGAISQNFGVSVRFQPRIAGERPRPRSSGTPGPADDAPGGDGSEPSRQTPQAPPAPGASAGSGARAVPGGSAVPAADADDLAGMSWTVRSIPGRREPDEGPGSAWAEASVPAEARDEPSPGPQPVPAGAAGAAGAEAPSADADEVVAAAQDGQPIAGSALDEPPFPDPEGPPGADEPHPPLDEPARPAPAPRAPVTPGHDHAPSARADPSAGAVPDGSASGGSASGAAAGEPASPAGAPPEAAPGALAADAPGAAPQPPRTVAGTGPAPDEPAGAPGGTGRVPGTLAEPEPEPEPEPAAPAATAFTGPEAGASPPEASAAAPAVSQVPSAPAAVPENASLPAASAAAPIAPSAAPAAVPPPGASVTVPATPSEASDPVPGTASESASLPGASAAAPVIRPAAPAQAPAPAPGPRASASALDGLARYGEPVLREILGARFVSEEPLPEAPAPAQPEGLGDPDEPPYDPRYDGPPEPPDDGED